MDEWLGIGTEPTGYLGVFSLDELALVSSLTRTDRFSIYLRIDSLPMIITVTRF